MGNVSWVIQQLKKELERAKREVKRYGATLVALGNSKLSGQRRMLSATARRKISLAQKARWAKQNGQAAAKTQASSISDSAARFCSVTACV